MNKYFSIDLADTTRFHIPSAYFSGINLEISKTRVDIALNLVEFTELYTVFKGPTDMCIDIVNILQKDIFEKTGFIPNVKWGF